MKNPVRPALDVIHHQKPPASKTGGQKNTNSGAM